MQISSFIDKYFLDPIRYGTGYNVVNTAVYALLLGVLVYLTIKLFKKVNIRLDFKFYIYFIPFLYLGSSLRVLRDYDVITSNLFNFFVAAKSPCVGEGIQQGRRVGYSSLFQSSH